MTVQARQRIGDSAIVAGLFVTIAAIAIAAGHGMMPGVATVAAGLTLIGAGIAVGR